MDEWGNIFNLVGVVLLVIGAINHSFWELIPGAFLVTLGTGAKAMMLRAYCCHMEGEGDD